MTEKHFADGECADKSALIESVAVQLVAQHLWAGSSCVFYSKSQAEVADLAIHVAQKSAVAVHLAMAKRRAETEEALLRLSTLDPGVLTPKERKP